MIEFYATPKLFKRLPINEHELLPITERYARLSESVLTDTNAINNWH